MTTKNEQTRADLEARLEAIAQEHVQHEAQYAANALKVAQGDAGASIDMRASADAQAVGQAERKAIEAALKELVKVEAQEAADAEEGKIRVAYAAYTRKLSDIAARRLEISRILEQAGAMYPALQNDLREAEELSRQCETYEYTAPTINQRGYGQEPRDPHSHKSERSFREYIASPDIWRLTEADAESQIKMRAEHVRAIGNRSAQAISRELKRKLAPETDQPPLAA